MILKGCCPDAKTPGSAFTLKAVPGAYWFFLFLRRGHQRHMPRHGHVGVHRDQTAFAKVDRRAVQRALARRAGHQLVMIEVQRLVAVHVIAANTEAVIADECGHTYRFIPGNHRRGMRVLLGQGIIHAADGLR